MKKYCRLIPFTLDDNGNVPHEKTTVGILIGDAINVNGQDAFSQPVILRTNGGVHNAL